MAEHRHLPSRLLPRCPVWTAHQGPKQTPICYELSCQGSNPHEALAAYHSHPPTAPLVTSQVTHHLQNSPAHLQISHRNTSQISTPTLSHALCSPLTRTCWQSPALVCGPLETGHSLPMLPHYGTAYPSTSALPNLCPGLKNTSKHSSSLRPLTPSPLPFFVKRPWVS